MDYWFIVAVVALIAAFASFLGFILYSSLIGPYGRAVAKAKMKGQKVSWFIDNHNDVHPIVTSGESGYRADDYGVFIPDPDHSITTDQSRGSLHDTNLSPALNFNLLRAIKKLTKFNVAPRRRIGENEELEETAYEQEEKATKVIGEKLKTLDSELNLSLSKELNRMNAESIGGINDFLINLSETLEYSEITPELKDEFETLIAQHLAETESTIIKFFEEKTNEIFETKKAEAVADVRDLLFDKILLSDPELKALRNYYNLVQPPYVERAIISRVNEEMGGKKDLTKVFIYACAGVAIVLGAIGLIIYFLGGNDPVIIIQNATEAVNNTTTLAT